MSLAMSLFGVFLPGALGVIARFAGLSILRCSASISHDQPWPTGALRDRLGSHALALAIAVGLNGLSAPAIWRAAPRKVRTVAGRTRHSAA